jgi:phosphatidylglycerophosphate synthase
MTNIPDTLPAYKRLQDALLHYPAIALSRAGMTPTAVSIAGVLAMLVAAFTMRSSVFVSIAFICASISADFLDGTLARYQKRTPPSGRVIDVATDVSSFLVFLAGLAAAGLASAPWCIVLGLIVVWSASVDTIVALRQARETHVSPTTLRGYWFFPNLAKFSCYAGFVLVAAGGPLLFGLLIPALSFLLFGEIAYRLIMRRHA